MTHLLAPLPLYHAGRRLRPLAHIREGDGGWVIIYFTDLSPQKDVSKVSICHSEESFFYRKQRFFLASLVRMTLLGHSPGECVIFVLVIHPVPDSSAPTPVWHHR